MRKQYTRYASGDFVMTESLSTLLLSAASKSCGVSVNGDIPCSMFTDLITRLKLVDSEDEAAVITIMLAKDVSDSKKLSETAVGQSAHLHYTIWYMVPQVNVFNLENLYSRDTWRELIRERDQSAK